MGKYLAYEFLNGKRKERWWLKLQMFRSLLSLIQTYLPNCPSSQASNINKNSFKSSREVKNRQQNMTTRYGTSSNKLKKRLTSTSSKSRNSIHPIRHNTGVKSEIQLPGRQRIPNHLSHVPIHNHSTQSLKKGFDPAGPFLSDQEGVDEVKSK